MSACAHLDYTTGYQLLRLAQAPINSTHQGLNRCEEIA